MVLLLAPSAIKLLHHHQHVDACTKHTSGNQVESKHGKCAVCDFEFSVFLDDAIVIDEAHTLPASVYVAAEPQAFIDKQPAFIFQKRGPPAC